MTIEDKKRMKKFTALLLCLALLLPLPSCGREKNRYSAQFLVLFDTMSELVAYMDSKEEFEKFSTFIYDHLKEYHELYDIYDDFPGVNNIKTINDNAGKQPVKVDPRIIDLLKLCKEQETATHGAFNIALGSVLRIWHQYREAGLSDPESAKLPPMEELQEAMKHTDIDNVVIDEEASTVYLADPEMSLDVGSVAKGYATEQVARLAEEAGYSSALLSIGGNVRAIGGKGVGEQAWNVGIRNPDTQSDQTSLMTVLLTEESLVTSGIYERYYVVDGKQYHHIIDPTTLMPSTNYQSVSVITRDSGLADILSTALFNMSYEESLSYVNSLPDAEALWVMPDGELRYSAGFQAYIKTS